jgi:DNA-binding HxlR family transcriptional regulator
LGSEDDNEGVGPTAPDDYCPFTKAIEHLGDRWNLLILRQLGLGGPLGFNALAACLPGRVSRSVLTDRLRALEDLGLVRRQSPQEREVPYALTPAGRGLMPMFTELRGWAATWLPDDPALAQRDPDVLPGWLARRADPRQLPARDVVLEITVRHTIEHRGWVVLRRGSEPYGCTDDPLLDPSRYVYVQAGVPVLLALAKGRRSWADAIADGSVTLSGDPSLTRDLPRWFMPMVDNPAAIDGGR